jgi:hypothetical protein
MPELNTYPAVAATGVDETDLLLWEIDGAIYKMTREEFRKLNSIIDEVAVSATTYTLLTSDQGKEVRATNASAKTFTVPAATAFLAGGAIVVSNRSATDITLSASGTTLNAATTTIGQNQSAVLKPRADNTWDVYVGGSSGGATQLNAPTTLACANPGETTAAVTYTDTNTSPNESSWEFYVYDNGSYTLPLVGTFTSAADATTVNLTGLTANTPYWVKGIAKGNGTTTSDSDLSAGFTFTTDAAAGLDADAQAYITAEETAGSVDIDVTNENAISDLFVALKASTDPWTAGKIKGIFLGYGTGLVNGADLTTATGTNLPAISAAGYTFDAVNDAINTGITPSTAFTGHEGYFTYIKTPTGSAIVGSREAGGGTYVFLNSGGDIVFRLSHASDVTVSGQGGAGRYAISRKSDTNIRVLKDGVSVYNSSEPAASPSTKPLAFGASNEDGAPFTPAFFAGGVVGALIITDDLTDAEITQIDTAVGAFITATSRT